MTDQAAELRKLVLAEARTAAGNFEHRPRLLVITGAKGGVGATTTAVNLAVALADHGARVVLVDADPNRAGVASLCGLDEQHGLADVLAARRDIHEVLVRGPAGIQVAPGVWAPDSRVVRATGPMPIDTGSGTVNDLFSERAAARLLRQLSGLGRHAEWAVLDVGQGPSVLLRAVENGTGREAELRRDSARFAKRRRTRRRGPRRVGTVAASAVGVADDFARASGNHRGERG